MAFDRILKSAPLMVLVPLVLITLAAMPLTQARAESDGQQTCSVVLFTEICTGATDAPLTQAPMMGGSILTLMTLLGGFAALRQRVAVKVADEADTIDHPAIED